LLAVFLFECTPAWQVAEAPDVPRLDLDMAVPVAAVTGTEAAPSEPSSSACPGAMVLVDGMYCPNLTQVCLRWVDPPTDMYPNTRCAEFKHPATCQGERVHERYCIDRDEYVRPPDVLPLVHLDWNDAEAACEERGERLCTEAQWELACEGEQMLPYPYGASRDSSACNFDRTDLGKMGEGLTDHRVTPGAFPACVSPFGVSDMVGNVDEWTVRAGASAPNRSALHGGWWLPGRNNCRAATLGHTEDYSGKQVGFRCCAPARP
jgi:hypothetical protein